MPSTSARSDVIIEVVREAFAPLMRADPVAFRAKYRKMALDPHAFYRGSACLFYNDVTAEANDWARHGAERIWIHGDLHVENFGTYLNSDGRLVFDINDFDEAYLGRFVWDLQRFAASLALVGWQKALPEDAVRKLIGRFVRSYLAQVNHYAGTEDDDDFALTLDNATGPVLVALESARALRRADLLDEMTVLNKGVRRFIEDATARRLGRDERALVVAAFRDYLETIPRSKRFDRALFYELRDVVGKSGFGIGSAGLPAYNVLVEGYSQALDNDVVLSMKQANIPAVSRFVDAAEVDAYFEHEGHRTVGQPAGAAGAHGPAARSHQDRRRGLRGHRGVAVRGGPGLVEHQRACRHARGRRPARPGDGQDPLRLRRGQRPGPGRHPGRGRHRGVPRRVVARDFTEWLCQWGIDYAVRVREDHALFVDAFREGRMGIAAT